jgi:hypothetical protein
MIGRAAARSVTTVKVHPVFSQLLALPNVPRRLLSGHLAIAKRRLYGPNFDFPKSAISSMRTELSLGNADLTDVFIT